MPLFTLLLTVLTLPVALFVWTLWSVRVNYVKARRAGFPVLIRWISPMNVPWMLIGSSFTRKCHAFNIGTPSFWRFYVFGWESRDRHRIHEELGGAFMQVTPGGNWLCVSDADVIDEVIRRPKDFRRNMHQFEVLNVYGKNLATTDDDEWKKHRKVTAVTFTERNNDLVWRQALAQTKGMLEHWTKHQPIRTTNADTKIFSLNVFAGALFNQNYSFQGTLDSKATVNAEDDSYVYRDSLLKILQNIVPILIFGEHGLQKSWTPQSWKRAGKAIGTFRSYITSLINEERHNIAVGNERNQHLVAALVRACQVDEDPSPKASGLKNMTLTEQETISNLWVYAFAGTDTTAVTLSHMIIDLAAHPDVQEWMAEELRHYLPENDISLWNYSTFAKLKRCLATVMESLRLNHPLGQLAKTTGAYPQSLKVGSTTHVVPPDTSIHLSLAAIHTHPKYWGSDSMQFHPQRFISTPEDSSDGLENEVLAPDLSTSFLPWAYGQRICPGKKFSQVELVAALAVLFRDHVVMPVTKDGESLEDARKRTFETSLDVDHEGTIIHEMRDPASVGLAWKKRDNTAGN